MSPTKTSKDGCYRFDRLFDGIGRIAVSSGAKTLREFHRRDDLLTKWYEGQRYDLLRALKGPRAKATMNQLCEAWSRGARSSAAVAESRPLWVDLEAMFRAKTRGAQTLKTYLTSVTGLRRLGVLPEDATVGDLLTLDLHAVEAQWGRSAASWNHVLRMIRRYLSLTFGKRSAVLGEMMEGAPWRQEIPRMPDVSPALFRAILSHVQPEVWSLYLAIAGTGFRRHEFVQLTRDDLMPVTSAVRIRKLVKTRESLAVIPLAPEVYAWLNASVPMPISWDAARERLQVACRKAGVPAITLHDLRHCYGQWLADAGGSVAEIQAGLRHATPFQAMEYTKMKGRRGTSERLAAVMVPQFVPHSIPEGSRSSRRKGA